MEANHPFSPTTAFPLSFFEEDMMLFTGGATPINGPHGTSASAADLAAAWADMGMGQGRSVSSIMNPYHIDTAASNAGGAGNPTSPTLASPLAGADGNMGFLSPRGNKKRSSNVDAMDDEDIQIPKNGANATTSNSTNVPAQKRRRRDTATNTNSGGGGSNTDGGFSSGDDETDRRDSIIGPDGKRQERPRLTEEEKKNNHIASEQKRRMAIRDGFDRLTELVPGIEGQGRSESIVLRKTVDYMRQVIEDRRNLIAQVQELGGDVPQELMLR
ncbi:hypothetical protein TWF694_009558 [Orbilia ellipsospora]|uniref:BHLH domain-containing protein n=1 Tax=Orbilia ellipsospora TaxID=2528407 RepID=A0AAV9XC76_9PEZI